MAFLMRKDHEGQDIIDLDSMSHIVDLSEN